jgi:hypothetical protein
MWATTERFGRALLAGPRFRSLATITVPGGSPDPIELKSGTVSCDSSQMIRRKTNVRAFGGAAEYAAMTTEGAILSIQHGLNYGDSTELVPVFYGEITSGEQSVGDGTISVSGADLCNRMERNRYIRPFTPTASTSRAGVISQAVLGSVPGATIQNVSSDTGTIGSALMWQESRLDTIRDLTRDGGTEAFWLPDGTYLVRDAPVLSSATPVWTSRTWKSVDRKRPMDRLYNMVVVRPSATDGSQGWTQQVVEITDPTHPRHKSKIGEVPYFWASPTITRAADAVQAGRKILERVLGTTETLSLSTIANPALEGGDVIRAVLPQLGRERPQSFLHYLDSFTLDLVTGSMSLATRSIREDE